MGDIPRPLIMINDFLKNFAWKMIETKKFQKGYMLKILFPK